MTARDSWYHEKESAWLYLQVACAETDPRKQRLFRQLAAAAEDQAAKWASGEPAAPIVPAFAPTLRARIVAGLIHHFGPRAVRPVLAAMKLRGLSIYSAPAGHPMPTSVSEVGARHRGGLGGNLRAAVFGVSDGLVSNASLVLGVAGSGAAGGYVLMTGIAGMLAGALSMASGEYVSVRTQREMYEYQMALERDEVARYPDEEAEELALIYEARGLQMQQARDLSRTLLADPDRALEVLAREELGLNPDDLGSPPQAALASFVAFAGGAALPLIPQLLPLAPGRLLAVTVGVTVVALFAVGLALSLFTGREALRGGIRMVLIGGGAGLVSFWVGKILGQALAP